MENTEKLPRFSSCRGVSFEIQPSKNSPFSTPPPPEVSELPGHWVWLPQTSGRSFKVFPLSDSSAAIHCSMSRPSSHFCDLEPDEDSNQTSVDEDIEQQANQALEKSASTSVSIKEVRRSNSESKKRNQSRLSIILFDQGLFSVYKRLFLLSFSLNAIFLSLAASGRFDYAKRHAALFAMANILILTLSRSEAFLRLLFSLSVLTLRRLPLPLKTAATSFLQSLGGVHSGCGVSSLAWLTYALIMTIHHREEYSKAIVAVASMILALLCLSCLAAFPLLRHLHHNLFERTHRFAGWSALALLWAFVFLTISYNSPNKSYDVRLSRLVRTQEFWFTLSITFFIVLPWVTVRRVPVSVTAPSNHASIIKFGGRGVKAGILGRISRSPFSEWHAFGIISDGKEGHMMLAGAVGDFTRGLVTDPPSHLWVRQVHFAGLPYLVNMYNRAVLVATGSGICVFLSFLLQPCSADVCLVWVAKGIEENFGQEILDMVSRFDKEKVVVHDTAVLGRPNVAEMAIEAVKRWKAEVVVVTSNPQGSRDVVEACKGVGIPAFGPIWDS